jgi:GABA(A) receptor-associated protein
MSEFKKNHTFDQRSTEAKRILKKYPDRIPIIIEKNKNCRSLPKFDKNKYLVPDNISLGQLIQIVRRKISVKPDVALFCFADNTIPTSGTNIRKLYNTYKENCGFLYLSICTENTFG